MLSLQSLQVLSNIKSYIENSVLPKIKTKIIQENGIMVKTFKRSGYIIECTIYFDENKDVLEYYASLFKIGRDETVYKETSANENNTK